MTDKCADKSKKDAPSDNDDEYARRGRDCSPSDNVTAPNYNVYQLNLNGNITN